VRSATGNLLDVRDRDNRHDIPHVIPRSLISDNSDFKCNATEGRLKKYG